jgi:hypothetical protein
VARRASSAFNEQSARRSADDRTGRSIDAEWSDRKAHVIVKEDMCMTKSKPAQPPEPQAPPRVSCRVCRREIPADIALCAEVEDYVLWFCGLDCYADWQREKDLAKDT